MLNQSKQSNPNSMVLGSCKVELYPDGIDVVKKSDGRSSWSFKGDAIDVGLLRGLSLTYASTPIEIKSDNGTISLKGENDSSYTVAFNLVERHLPILKLIHQGLTGFNIISDEVKNERQTFKIKGASNRFTLDKINADGTEPTDVNVVVDGTVVESTKYRIELKNSAYTVTILDESLLKDADELEVLYKVAAAKAYQLTKGMGGIAKPIGMKLINKRKTDTGRIITRTFEFPYLSFNGADAASFKNGADADAVLEVPVQYIAEVHPDMIAMEELQDSCLMRETQEI